MPAYFRIPNDGASSSPKSIGPGGKMDTAKLVQMYRLAVWDSLGRMYMPVYGYDGQISHYAFAREALLIFFNDQLRS